MPSYMCTEAMVLEKNSIQNHFRELICLNSLDARISLTILQNESTKHYLCLISRNGEIYSPVECSLQSSYWDGLLCDILCEMRSQIFTEFCGYKNSVWLRKRFQGLHLV